MSDDKKPSSLEDAKISSLVNQREKLLEAVEDANPIRQYFKVLREHIDQSGGLKYDVQAVITQYSSKNPEMCAALKGEELTEQGYAKALQQLGGLRIIQNSDRPEYKVYSESSILFKKTVTDNLCKTYGNRLQELHHFNKNAMQEVIKSGKLDVDAIMTFDFPSLDPNYGRGLSTSEVSKMFGVGTEETAKYEFVLTANTKIFGTQLLDKKDMIPPLLPKEKYKELLAKIDDPNEDKGALIQKFIEDVRNGVGGGEKWVSIPQYPTLIPLSLSREIRLDPRVDDKGNPNGKINYDLLDAGHEDMVALYQGRNVVKYNPPINENNQIGKINPQPSGYSQDPRYSDIYNMAQLLAQMDKDGSGTITANEVSDYSKDLQKRSATKENSPDYKKVWAIADTNRDGEVSAQEINSQSKRDNLFADMLAKGGFEMPSSGALAFAEVRSNLNNTQTQLTTMAVKSTESGIVSR